MGLKSKRMRRCLGGLGVALGLGLIGLGFAYQNARTLLAQDSGPVKADVIILLGGGWNERSERAAELFREGAARRLL